MYKKGKYRESILMQGCWLVVTRVSSQSYSCAILVLISHMFFHFLKCFYYSCYRRIVIISSMISYHYSFWTINIHVSQLSILSLLLHSNYMYILVRTCMEGFIGNTQSNINNPEGSVFLINPAQACSNFFKSWKP